MTDISSHSFLLLLEQVKNQTDNYESYFSSLQEQQKMFKVLLQEYIYSEEPAPRRFHILKNAKSELSNIRSMHGARIRENHPVLFEKWTLLIKDTRRCISNGIEMLQFQAVCPAHIPAHIPAKPEDPEDTLPIFVWTAQKIDFAEVLTGFITAGVIRLQDGRIPSFALMAETVGRNFGITYKDPHKIFDRVINRKRDQTAFLNTLICHMKKYQNQK
jgi:hypothetical protein